ncbi:MAG TPA: hypothetical protein DDW42_10390 [Desulfobacteraceae bacterium]|nr:hypothetical protein [Desulfobacteraceae bacterium]
MITIKIYKDRDNIASVELLSNGAAQDITNLTRATITLGDLLVDSSIHTGVFDWTTSGAAGQLDIAAGHVSTLEKGAFTSVLTVFDATYPNGLVWGEMVTLVE